MNQPHDPNVTSGVDSIGKRIAVPPSVTQRYTLGDEIARGGMGVVYRATDTVLGREVAVKVLHEKYPSESGAAFRFAGEARISGQLQHPSIPPVHDLGTLPDGRPFLAMKLIKGQTLEVLLKARPDPSAERGRFVAVFEQICQALAYAHAHDVIHRDLKPANVMVGAFGEVQVMDWGLAKVLGAGTAPASPIEAANEPTRAWTQIDPTPELGSHTQAGSMLGTPAFAPPEQVAGELDKVDARADVFGLGAILAVLLTGKPPYVGKTFESVRVQAVRGKLDDCFARLDACGAEPELVALCKRCLAFEPGDRPANAGVLARAVAKLRAAADERARRAELQRVRVEGDKATAEAREAEQRKRRKVQLALAAAVVLLLLGGGVLLLGGGSVAWWQNEQASARRATDLQRQLEDEKRLADDRDRRGRNAEAVTALLGQCEEALRAGDTAKAAVALDAARKRSAEGGAEEQATRLGRLDADLALLRDLDAVDQFRMTPADSKFPDPAVVATRNREALGRFGANPDAVSVDDMAARVSASMVRDRIVPALDRLLPHEKTAGVRAVLKRVDADPYRDAVRDAVVAGDWAKFVELAEQPAALEQPPGFAAFPLGDSEAIKVERRRKLLESALSRRSEDLGLLMTLGGTYPADQKEGANERLRWFQAAVAAAPTNVAAYTNLGNALKDTGQVDEAVACYKKAIELDPKLAAAHTNLGIALKDKGQVDEAIACQRKAIALDSKYALPHANLGLVLAGRGQLDEAIACYKKAIELDPMFASAHNSLGVALNDKGQVDGAIACYKKAIELDPKDAKPHNNLGVSLKDKGQVDEAIACYKKAIELDPKFAEAHTSMGSAMSSKGQLDEAIAWHRKAIKLDPKLAAAHTNLGSALQNKGQLDEAIACHRKAIERDPKLAGAHTNLGNALYRKGQVDEAIACWQKAIEFEPKNSTAHNSLGAVFYGKGQLDEAIACYKKAIEFDPKYANAHSNLGVALAGKGQLDEASASFKKAIELDPKFAGPHSYLGLALAGKGQLDEAIASHRKAIELDPKFAAAHTNLGIALAGKGQLDEAIASFKKAIELEPKNAMAHNNLGIVLYGKGHVEEAIACHRKAIELDPKFAGAHINLGRALHGKGQVDEAIACWRKAIAFDPNNANAHNNLGAVFYGKGQLDEAIACCKKAIELDPKLAGAHSNLGSALYDKGQLDEAIACQRKAIELDPKFAEARSNLAQAERMAAFRDKLAAFQNGTYTPASTAERLGLVEWCQFKKLHHTATSLYAAAFAADPKLAADLGAGHRYKAACHAAFSAAGQGADAAKVDDKERTRLRQQALGWLRADLALRTKQQETGKPADRAEVQKTMRHWQQDTNLAGIRNAAALAQLPTDEQKACTQLWADVAALLTKAGEEPK
jgi:tetratricopeptide (TPR) repeat protein